MGLIELKMPHLYNRVHPHFQLLLNQVSTITKAHKALLEYPRAMYPIKVVLHHITLLITNQ